MRAGSHADRLTREALQSASILELLARVVGTGFRGRWCAASTPARFEHALRWDAQGEAVRTQIQAASVRRIGPTASITGWVQDLPLAGLALVVFAGTLLVAAAVYIVVMALAVGDRGAAFKAMSPGMLPPMGLLFGLIVGFLAAQVWSDAGRAQDAVNSEASALRSVVLLDRAFPGAPEARMDALVRRHIRDVVDEEWPAMAHQRETLTVIPAPLAQALQLAIGLSPRTEGQKEAQRGIVDSLQSAFDARRQRIIVSESTVNWVKWAGVILVALLTLIAIAFVHSDNRLTAALAMGIFSAAVAASLMLIAAQARPFSGQFAVRPDVLVQVTPQP
jgi:Protein of unknown function (DUF4239)